MKKLAALILTFQLGATLSAFTNRIEIDDLSRLGFDGIGITNHFALEAIKRIDLYSPLLEAYLALQGADEAKGAQITALNLSLSNRGAAYDMAAAELIRERAAQAADKRREMVKWLAVGGGSGLVLGVVVSAVILGSIRK